MWPFANINQKAKISTALGKHKTDQSGLEVKTPPPQPAHMLPALSSHIPLVCGYHTRKHSCVTHACVLAGQALHSVHLYTQFWSTSPNFAVTWQAGIPRSMGTSLYVPHSSTSSVKVLKAMQVTVDSLPRCSCQCQRLQVHSKADLCHHKEFISLQTSLRDHAHRQNLLLYHMQHIKFIKGTKHSIILELKACVYCLSIDHLISYQFYHHMNN